MCIRDRCIADLDKALITPKVYSEENLPSFWPWDKVQKLLQTVKEDVYKRQGIIHTATQENMARTQTQSATDEEQVRTGGMRR